jgi:hypothetical protein
MAKQDKRLDDLSTRAYLRRKQDREGAYEDGEGCAIERICKRCSRSTNERPRPKSTGSRGFVAPLIARQKAKPATLFEGMIDESLEVMTNFKGSPPSTPVFSLPRRRSSITRFRATGH